MTVGFSFSAPTQSSVGKNTYRPGRQFLSASVDGAMKFFFSGRT